jgi:hypothetical protein
LIGWIGEVLEGSGHGMMGLTIPAFPRTVKNHEIIRISGISAET